MLWPELMPQGLYILTNLCLPFLSSDLKERAYGTDCRIYTPEQPNKFKNVYVRYLRRSAWIYVALWRSCGDLLLMHRTSVESSMSRRACRISLLVLFSRLDPLLSNSFQDTLFDEFVIAHVLGWYCKAITLRSTGLIWTLSIGFELMEVSFSEFLSFTS